MNKIIYVDGQLWTVMYQSAYDVRLQSFDPQTLTLLEDSQHPIYHGTDLAWDGAHFGAWDFETQTFAKLALEEGSEGRGFGNGKRGPAIPESRR